MILYSTIPIVTEGTLTKAVVADIDAEHLLSDMLKELKKLNLHMSLVNDTNINNTEVEV